MIYQSEEAFGSVLEQNENSGRDKLSNNSSDSQSNDTFKVSAADMTSKRTRRLNQVRPTVNFSTSQVDGCVKIRNTCVENESPITVPAFLEQAVKNYPNAPALASKCEEGLQWKLITFEEYLKNIRTVAKAFLKLGLERYHSVAILGRNSPQWFIADLAAIFAGGFASGIYATNLPEACLYCLNVGSANIVVVEDDVQLQKILKIKEKANDLKAIIQYSGKPTDNSVISWDDLLKLGNEETDERLESVIENLAANECCSLLFTSGTVGPPKAVMLSHDNLIFSTKIICEYIKISKGTGRILSYLPLSHAAAQIADIYVGIASAACCYFGDKNILKGSLVENLKEIQPTMMFGVPRIWEKIKEGLETHEKTLSIMQKYILSLAKYTAKQHYENMIKGESEGETFWKYRIFRRLVYSKVKSNLGLDKCTLFLVGAAPCSIAVKEYLCEYGIHIGEIFGMSETTGPHTAGVGVDMVFETAGKPLPGLQVKIDKPDENGVGEVCMYGRNIFMGYLGNEEKTREAIDEEGWLHSGDTGKCDKNSHLQIVGRIKELLITSGGENVAPVPIEMIIKQELPVISQAVVIGDARKFLSVLLTLKSQLDLDSGYPLDELSPEVKSWCEFLGCDSKTVSDVIKEKPSRLYDAIQTALDKVNEKAISEAQKIRKFTILPKDFSSKTGELGPTLKIKRNVVYEKYKDEIEAIYNC